MMPSLCIVGSHPDVTNEIEAVPKYGAWDVMAIGLDAVNKYLERILYVATYHPVEIEKIRERRRSVGGNLDYKVISHEKHPGVDIIITDWWKPTGSSALLGVQAALRMGYRKIVLCGCPLIGINDKGSKYENFQSGWKKHREEVAPYVRSMSGWTREFLSMPTVEWLMEGNGE